jgi:hypothetical protein
MNMAVNAGEPGDSGSQVEMGFPTPVKTSQSISMEVKKISGVEVKKSGVLRTKAAAFKLNGGKEIVVSDSDSDDDFQ